MHLARTLARSSLIGRPGRTLFSVLGIGLGIATVVGIFTLDQNTIRSRSRRAAGEWQAEIEISPSARAADPLRELRSVEGLEDVTAAFQNQAALWAPDQSRPRIVHLVAVEAEGAEKLGAWTVARGRQIDPDAERPEVLLGAALVDELGLELGDRIELSRPRRAPRRHCRDGEWVAARDESGLLPLRREYELVGVLAREGLGRRARGEIAILDYQDGLRLFEGANVQTRYWARRDPSVDLERTEKLLSSAYSYELEKSVIVGQAADERAFRNGVRFAGLLALVLGLFVIFYTLSRSLLERVREIGTLHALGATRAQVARIFLLEATAISALGGLVGLGGGLLLARVLLRAGITTLGRGAPVRSFSVPWQTALPLTLLGVAIALVGSVYPLLRARSLSVVAALRGEEHDRARRYQRGFQLFALLLLAVVLPAAYLAIVPVLGQANEELTGVILTGLGVLGVFLFVPLVAPAVLGVVSARLVGPLERRWPLAGLLAGRAMRQSPARVAGAIAGLALVVGGFSALRGMTRSLEAEIRSWARVAFLDKVYVSGLPSVDFDWLAAELHAWPGVVGVEPCDARHYVPFLVVGLEPRELAGWGPCAENPELLRRFEEENGVFLSRRLSEHIGLGVGDTVHVTTGAGRVESLPVLAVTDAYGYAPHPDERLYGCVPREALRQFFCIDVGTVDSISVRIADGRDPGLVQAAVQDILARAAEQESGASGGGAGSSPPPAEHLRFETGPAVFDWHVKDVRRDFVLFDLIITLTAALAGLGILNGQLLAALERAKELGVLRALGTARRQVAGTVLLEAAVVGLLGGVLGGAIGSALDPIIIEALRAVSGLPLESRGPGPALLVGLAGALVVALSASIYPIWRMNRTSAVEAVRSPG